MLLNSTTKQALIHEHATFPKRVLIFLALFVSYFLVGEM